MDLHDFELGVTLALVGIPFIVIFLIYEFNKASKDE